jgi:hypothetical protein
MAKLTETQKAARIAARRINAYTKALRQYAADEIDFDALMKKKTSAENLASNPSVDLDAHDRVDAITRKIAAASNARHEVRTARNDARTAELRDEQRAITDRQWWR